MNASSESGEWASLISCVCVVTCGAAMALTPLSCDSASITGITGVGGGTPTRAGAATDAFGSWAGEGPLSLGYRLEAYRAGARLAYLRVLSNQPLLGNGPFEFDCYCDDQRNL